MSIVHRRGPTAPDMNITPLIDVVFLLIIFFMLVSRIVADENVPMVVPALEDPKTYEPGQVERIVVNVVPADGSRGSQPLEFDGEPKEVRVGQNRYDLSDLEGISAALLAARERNPELEVNLRADAALFFETVQPVMGAITEAGIGRINLVAELPSNGAAPEGAAVSETPPLDAPDAEEFDEPIVHHVSQRKKRGLPAARMRLNLTSMIDVIFQLLIYFLVTASFAVNEGVITARLPKGGSAPATDKPPEIPLKILLTSAGTSGVSISIEGRQRARSFTELIALLESMQNDPERLRSGQFKPDNPVIIKPDGQVRWQHVVNGFNAAIAARYTKVSFALAGEK